MDAFCFSYILRNRKLTTFLVYINICNVKIKSMLVNDKNKDLLDEPKKLVLENKPKKVVVKRKNDERK